VNTYIVEGRRFNRRLHAVTFATSLACEFDRSVDVKVEVKDFLGRFQRSWMCRMHPPGKVRTVLKRPDIPQVHVVAV
jgi:hypothetical protein